MRCALSHLAAERARHAALARAVERIKVLLLNTHHLLNSFRVNHAREELIASVQAQLDAKQQLLDEI